MQMPMTGAGKHEAYRASRTENELFEKLISKHEDFIDFFVDACDDETWCNAHASFIKSSLKWLNARLYNGELSIDAAKVAAKAIREHSKNLEQWIPNDLTCELKDKTLPIDSFLFQTVSPYWFHLIRSQCAQKGKAILNLDDVGYFEFKIIKEYVYTGENQKLWNLTESELLQVLQYARSCELDSVAESAERNLGRFVDETNFLYYLALADERSFEEIKKCCCDFYNRQQNLIVLTSLGNRCISVEVNTSNETSLELLAKIKNYVTHFVSGSTTIEDSAIVEVLKNCPRLVSIDLGKARDFSENAFRLSNVSELVLAGCLWLRDYHLKRFCAAFQNLEKLDLTGCSQITSAGWGELTHLSRLRVLNVSRNENLNDLQFGLILTSGRHLEELSINGCRNLTHASFHAIAKGRQRFVTLGLGRTTLTDAGLLEIVSKIPSLSYLDLSRCSNLTEEGILAALKLSHQLLQVNMSELQLSLGAVDVVNKLKPYVKFVFT